MKLPKVLLLYQHYPYSIGLLFKRGFRALGVEVKSVGNCTDEKIPWGKNIKLPADTPTYQLKEFGHHYRPDSWLKYASWADLVVCIDSNHHYVGNRDGFTKIIVGTDPHAIPGYPGRREDCDIFVCMQNCYARRGDFWLPYAYDYNAHYPPGPVGMVMSKRPTDVVFGGCQHFQRRNDLEKLTKAGLNVDAFTGIVLDGYRERYWRAKLAYAMPTENDLPARFFESMAIGVPPVTKKVPDMDNLGAEDGTHYLRVGRHDIVDTCKRAINDEVFWEGLVFQGMEWVRPHTWARRASQLLQVTGYLPGDHEAHDGAVPKL